MNSPRVESTHGVVALQATVHDGSVSLLRDTLFGDLGINPLREAPHLRADLAKLHRGGGVVLDGILEGLVEVAIVQEDVWVVIPAVEVALDRLDRLDYTIKLLVPGQDDENAVGARLGGIGLEAAFDEDLVVFLADFPVGRNKGQWAKLWSMTDGGAYLIAGGAPAGMSMRPGEFGCLTKRTRIRMTTINGNSITTPTGMEMVEFPLKRNGLRKKARRDHKRPDLVFDLCIFSSAVGS